MSSSETTVEYDLDDSSSNNGVGDAVADQNGAAHDAQDHAQDPNASVNGWQTPPQMLASNSSMNSSEMNVSVVKKEHVENAEMNGVGGGDASKESGDSKQPSADVDMDDASSNSGGDVVANQNGAAHDAQDDAHDPNAYVNGWETPPQECVNGQVQPRVIPPHGKPTRHTNQLDFIAREVLKPAKNHKQAWPFLKPVDAIKLGIVDYHKVIKRPMDLMTIEKRLKNVYYYSAAECLRDFNTVFSNCYKFNHSEDDVTLMGRNVERVFRERLEGIPEEEFEIARPKNRKRPAKGGDMGVAKRRNPGNHGGSASTGGIDAVALTSVMQKLADALAKQHEARRKEREERKKREEERMKREEERMKREEERMKREEEERKKDHEERMKHEEERMKREDRDHEELTSTLQEILTTIRTD